MQQLTNQQKLKPWMGFVLFAVVMALFLTACSYMQVHWGVIGLLTTELLFLAIAIGYGLIFRIPLKEMFPIKKFSARDFFGSVLLVMGGLSFGIISVAVVGILIPSSLEGGDVQALQQFMGGASGFFVTLLIMAVSPAVCEEAIHRGAILSNFRSIKKDWVIVLIMGLLFGINHMSVLRFINTAILGACLSYIVVKKNNILLSAMMHFGVNAFSVTTSFISSFLTKGGMGEASSTQLTPELLKTALGTYLMMGVAAPFMIVVGLMLLSPQTHKKKRFLVAGIIAGVMLISSIGITFFSAMKNTLAQSTISYEVSEEDSKSSPIDFSLEKDGRITVVCVVMGAEGKYAVRVEKDDDKDFYTQEDIPEGSIRTLTKQIDLEAGSYKFYLVNGAGSKGEKPTFSVQIQAQ